VEEVFEATCNGFHISGTLETVCNCEWRDTNFSMCKSNDNCKLVNMRIEHIASEIVFKWKTNRIHFDHDDIYSEPVFNKQLFEWVFPSVIEACSVPKDELPLYINANEFIFASIVNLRMLHGV